MTVPRLLLLTDRRQARRPVRDVVAAAVDGGCRAVLVREKDLPHHERAALAGELAPIVHGAGGVLLAAGMPLPGCDGVHLPRPSGPPAAAGDAGGLRGRSCHDAVELAAAEAERADYVTLSPVFATASKPGYGPAIGTDVLAALVRSTAIPVLALGGVDSPEQVRRCLDAGAHGVAVMGAVMRADDPARLTRQLVAPVEASA